jgi:hypothetical protein
MRRSLLVLGCVFIAWAAACGSDQSVFDDGPGSSSGGGTSSGSLGSSSGGTSGSSGADASQTLRIDPPSATVDATGSIGALVGTASFKALLNGSPTPVQATWSTDDAGIGTIDSNGTFSAGLFAGKTTVRARVGNLEATAEVTVNLKVQENAASLADGDKAKLRAGGSADASFKWLYPYDRTVFPRGLPALTLQFSGAAPTALRVHFTSKQLDYEGFYAGTGNAARVPLSQDLWKALTQSAKAGDPITVEVTKLEGDAVTGPITETWNVAQGSLKGTVFYNSYNSKLAAGQTGYTGAGAVMRVRLGSPVEVLIGLATVSGKQEACIVCHSVAAQGTRLVAGIDFDFGPPLAPVYSGSFSISSAGAATLEYSLDEGRALPFGALTPDAKYLLGNGTMPSGPNLRGLGGDVPSRLYDASNGNVLADAYFGGGTNRYALSPAFSPDGKALAFTDKSADASARVLGLLSFDATATPPAFSNYQTLVTSGDNVVAWPTFTADAKAVLFHEGDNFDTALDPSPPAPAPPATMLTPQHADLKWVDIGTKTVAALDAVNGWRNNGASVETYLPYGEGEDAHLNYEPTLLPVAVGGYYWVVFTSRRSFGNTIYDGPSSIHGAGDKAFENGNTPETGYRKKLWVAAIDIAGTPGADISHPAFYLEGQETQAGNMRGFWALDPCKQDGSSCESGEDCCGGFCRQVDQNGSQVKLCVPPGKCANETEKCSIDADCCDAASGVKCIGGFCNEPTPSTPR